MQNIVHVEKGKLVETSRVWSYLKHYLKCFDEFCKEKTFISVSLMHKIENFFENALVTFRQLKILLETCPMQISDESKSIEIPVLLHKSDDFPCFKNDTAWNKAIEKINEGTNLIQKLYISIEKNNSNFNSIEYNLVQPQYISFADINSVISNMMSLFSIISDIKTAFADTTISKSFKWLQDEAFTLQQSLEQASALPAEESSVNQCKKLAENLIEKILFIVQSIYKKYNSQTEPEHADDPVDTSEDSYILHDGHLKVLMVENLADDVAILSMKDVLLLTNKLARKIMVLNPSKNPEIQGILQRTLPLLEQITLLYEYFLTQQVSSYRVTCKMSSILLNIFIELVSKVSSKLFGSSLVY